jgi:hypothetical protein
MQDLWKRIGPLLLIAQSGKHHVDVIRHYHDAMQVNCLLMLAQARFQHNVADVFRKLPSVETVKRNEKGTIALLQMR